MTDRINDVTIVKLVEVTQNFGEAYELAKETVDTRDTLKTEFYEAANEALTQQRLPRKTIDVPSGEETATYVAKHHPGWRTVESTPTGATISVIIERDPAQMKYTFTNVEDGKTYQRTYTEGSPFLDDERLRDEDPDLWDRITAWPEPIYSIVLDLFADDEPELNAEEYLRQRQDVSRTLRPPVEWDKEDVAAAQAYMLPGKLTMKIVPPRIATPEELEEALAELDAAVA